MSARIRNARLPYWTHNVAARHWAKTSQNASNLIPRNCQRVVIRIHNRRMIQLGSTRRQLKKRVASLSVAHHCPFGSSKSVIVPTSHCFWALRKTLTNRPRQHWTNTNWRLIYAWKCSNKHHSHHPWQTHWRSICTWRQKRPLSSVILFKNRVTLWLRFLHCCYHPPITVNMPSHLCHFLLTTL